MKVKIKANFTKRKTSSPFIQKVKKNLIFDLFIKLF